MKKGQGTLVEEYRGVTVMPTLYKVYAAVLAERLREKVEGRGMLYHRVKQSLEKGWIQ